VPSLSETGLVGLFPFVASAALLNRPVLRRRGHELALAFVLPAYLVHGLVDIDWDFAAVSAPAFLVAGALAGRAPFRRVSPYAALPAAGAAILAVGVLVLPWLGERWANDALGAAPAHAVKLADRADMELTYADDGTPAQLHSLFAARFLWIHRVADFVTTRQR